MRQVSPLPAGGAGIQVPYGKTGMQRQSPSREEPDSDEHNRDPSEEATAQQSAPPAGMGRLVDRMV